MTRNQLIGLAAFLILIAVGGYTVSAWIIPAINREKAKPFLQAFRDAEIKYGLPSDLLSRVAYQESRYNPDAISPAGAQGLMQFMPATAASFGINPLDPFQSIDAAGKYMQQLYQMFGNWSAAIAAYNFGPGNIKKNITKYGSFNVAALPSETQQYLTIASDIGVA